MKHFFLALVLLCGCATSKPKVLIAETVTRAEVFESLKGMGLESVDVDADEEYYLVPLAFLESFKPKLHRYRPEGYDCEEIAVDALSQACGLYADKAHSLAMFRIRFLVSGVGHEANIFFGEDYYFYYKDYQGGPSVRLGEFLKNGFVDRLSVVR